MNAISSEDSIRAFLLFQNFSLFLPLCAEAIVAERRFASKVHCALGTLYRRDMCPLSARVPIPPYRY